MKRILIAAMVVGTFAGCATVYKLEDGLEEADALALAGRYSEAADKYKEAQDKFSKISSRSRREHRMEYAADRQVTSLIAAGDFERAKAIRWQAYDQTRFDEWISKPVPVAQESAAKYLKLQIKRAQESDAKEPSSFSKTLGALASTAAIMGGAYTGAKINQNLQSNDPEKSARARQAKESMATALNNASQQSVSDKARKSNDANLCLQTKDDALKRRTDRIYVNACDVPVYFSIVHYKPNSKPTSTVYFKQVGAGGQHLVLGTDGGATHAEVTSCFKQPIRKYDEREKGYYAECPDERS